MPTDLLIHFYASGSNTVPIIGTTYSSQAFDAAAGAWSGSNSSSNSLSYGSGSSAGSYTLSIVPEPASFALASLGLLGLALRSRRQ
jgi:small-conductance mechanosensitive channel